MAHARTPFVWTVETAEVEHTQRLAGAFAAASVPLPSEGLTLDLRGPLGVGKTAFVQGLARGLRVPPSARVVSPTFTIARSYPCALPGVEVLHHLDAYRLAGPEDLEACGFEEMCGAGYVTCVEWGNRVEDGLPADRLLLRFAAQDATRRSLQIEATGPAAAVVAQRWAEVAQ